MAYFQRISVMTNGVVVKHLLYNTWYNSRYNRYICTKSTIFCCFFIQKLYLCKPNPSLIKRGHLLPNKLCSRFLLIFLPFVLYQCTFYLSIRTLWLHRRKWLWTHFLPMNPVFLSLREVANEKVIDFQSIGRVLCCYLQNNCIDVQNKTNIRTQ